MHRRGFRALVAAEVVSSLGSLMASVALPWFVLQRTDSPAWLAAVLAAESAPLLLVGVPSARLVARLGARRALLWSDALRAPAVAAVPALHALGALPPGLIVALAFLAGVPWAAAVGSQAAVVAELAGEGAAAVGRASAALQTASRTTYLVGPAVGGVAVAALGAPLVLWLDAASFLGSFLLIRARVPMREPVVTEVPAAAGGWARLREDRWLARVTGAQALSQMAFMGVVASVPVLAFRGAHGAGTAGLLLAVWGGGAALGGPLAGWLLRAGTGARIRGPLARRSSRTGTSTPPGGGSPGADGKRRPVVLSTPDARVVPAGASVTDDLGAPEVADAPSARGRRRPAPARLVAGARPMRGRLRPAPARLGALAWAGQAAPLWLLVASRAPGLAAVALGLSGVANGVRVPPVAGLIAEHVPASVRAETLTATSTLVLGGGFVALLAVGPLLTHATLCWAGIALLQTAAATLFALTGLRGSNPARAPAAADAAPGSAAPPSR